jgi:hypothetical protein
LVPPSLLLSVLPFLYLILPARVESSVLLNEVVAANQTGIVDEDGEPVDWIEVYNPGPGPADLSGIGISDTPGIPFKWTFPPVALAPEDRLVVYASGKDRIAPANHWETVIDLGDLWRYRLGDSEPPTSWRNVDFDDAAWPQGPSGLGYGDGDDLTVLDPTVSFFIRKTFVVGDLSLVRSIYFHVDYDDAFVAYINDIEVARDNIGTLGDHPTHDQLADRDLEARMYRGLPPAAFFVQQDPQFLLRPGSNVLAIQVHNASPASDDMTMIPFLTLGMTVPPASPQGTPDILQPSLPHMHTNFKIDAGGETLSLTDRQGGTLDTIQTGQLYFDLSRGRQPDGGGAWWVFAAPTPDAANTTLGYAGFATAPTAAPPGGPSPGPVTVTLTPGSSQATVRYTLDGGDPDESSNVYSAPIPISETRVLRARAFEDGLLPSRITTCTYLIDEGTTLPVVSLATDPPNLWDPETGIYVNWEEQDWERPFHLEFFPEDASPGFKVDLGGQIHGDFSRQFPQKSFAVFARGGYGAEEIGYSVFDERSFESYKRLLLRNAGSDWCQAHFRDGLCHRLAAHTDLDRLAYRPSIGFLNGQYWGIYELREKPDQYYLESNHGVDPDNVDLLENHLEVLEGDAEHFQLLFTFVANNDLSLESNYQYVQTLMDTDNYAEYCIFEIYLRNADWLENNLKYWRPRTPGGRWRWVLFDLDAGLRDPAHNTLAMALDPANQWATTLLRGLLENEGFRHRFINRYADHMNSSFLPQRMHGIADGIKAELIPELQRHFNRWGVPISNWFSNVASVDNFIDTRTSFARAHLMNIFGIQATLNLSLDVDPPATGSIRLVAVTIDSTWSGTYFAGIPIRLTAVPAPGYTFAGWSDPKLPFQPSVLIDPGGDYGVTALFEPSALGTIVINEINYHSSNAFNPEDWVEFVNPSPSDIDISGWEFKDEDDAHVFSFPPITIPAGNYLVLCQDRALFQVRFPEVTNIVGDMGFGLSAAGDHLRLYDHEDRLVDQVLYDDSPPWPPEPDGLGPTLELRHPSLDNALPQSWAASLAPHGTPGAPNSILGTGVGSGPAPTLTTTLLAAYPNPMLGHGTFPFAVGTQGPVRLLIYDVAGRRVRTLVDARLAPGFHAGTWDGRNDRGRRVGRGIYFYELVAQDKSIRRKLAILD